jgi:hypothetical protein
LTEWLVTPRPRTGAHGLGGLSCSDGDPRCDFGDAPEECTFRVGLCFAIRDRRLPRCAPAPLDLLDLVQPSEEAAEVDRVGFENRRSILTAIQNVGEPGGMETCTSLADVRVPLGQSHLLVAAVAGGRAQRSGLSLRCNPESGTARAHCAPPALRRLGGNAASQSRRPRLPACDRQ